MIVQVMATNKNVSRHNTANLRSTLAIVLAVALAYGVSWWLMPNSRPWSALVERPVSAAASPQKKHASRQTPAQKEVLSAHAQTTAKPVVVQTDCSAKKCIALTFDDGPNSVTPRLLDILKANNTQASFFIIGRQIAGHEQIIKRIYSEGHDIGNHTWDHMDFKKVPLDVMKDQVARTDQAIEAVTGKKPAFVRPPFGSFGPEHLAAANRPFILWNIDPDDWTTPDSNAIHDRVMQTARPGAIIISHDIYDTTVDAYARIVPELQQQGYSLVTVTDLLDITADNAPVQPFYYQ